MALNPRFGNPRKPLVSILIFNYNYGPYLRECFDSVLAQTYDNIEICFSDNASTDESWNIALEYQARHPNVIFIARNRRNFGPDANFSNCWGNARGKYFVELCSDDALLPDFAERCVRVMESDREIAFTLVHRAILDEHGERHEEPPFYNTSCRIEGPEQAAVYMMAAVNPAISQIMYRKAITHGKSVVGGLAARWYGTRIMDFNICCDFPIAYVKEPLMLHRMHLANDSFGAASNMMEVIGPYVLNHQFADTANAYGHQKVVDRLPASIEKVAGLALRYSVRALLAGHERNARRYLDMATAFCPEIRDNETCIRLSRYWTLQKPEERRDILDTLAIQDNLVTRSVSYDPPPGSTPLP
ncbi:glycosyltransferase family 2 protein [Pseudothauera nasutitermitis]|uniref:Glycosyltransferase family 2 protein n=1 Tax=Pseudothauera nasutitermitis TaxID=2565930 RepID=A0A4S4AZR0_9RHOO|nr:glycosyltransferase family A protein [Pseudothauera nasutitermitis]THF65679.1 glycosyltransferase family 2 protein [Pseudothauera nasutitermitis]